jgi:hypothetical protein
VSYINWRYNNDSLLQVHGVEAYEIAKANKRRNNTAAANPPENEPIEEEEPQPSTSFAGQPPEDVVEDL